MSTFLGKKREGGGTEILSVASSVGAGLVRMEAGDKGDGKNFRGLKATIRRGGEEGGVFKRTTIPPIPSRHKLGAAFLYVFLVGGIAIGLCNVSPVV